MPPNPAATAFDSIFGAIFGPRRSTRAKTSPEEQRAFDRALAGESPPRDPRPLMSRPQSSGETLVREAQSAMRSSRGRELSPSTRRTVFLAEGALERERARARETGLPLMRERRAIGAQVSGPNVGQVVYEDRERLMSEVLADVSQQTGAPRSYLEALIGHESAGDPNARPPVNPRTGRPASTATGLGQFTEDTWLGAIMRYGAQHGEPELASAITRVRNRNGAWVHRVDDPAMRRRILAMRSDPRWMTVMTGHHGQELAVSLRSRLGRQPREGEVYLAHFAGELGAERLIKAAAREPVGRGRPAIEFVDRAAVEANHNVFYHRDGRPRTAREVVERQRRAFSDAVWPERAREATR